MSKEAREIPLLPGEAYVAGKHELFNQYSCMIKRLRLESCGSSISVTVCLYLSITTICFCFGLFHIVLVSVFLGSLVIILRETAAVLPFLLCALGSFRSFSVNCAIPLAFHTEASAVRMITTFDAIYEGFLFVTTAHIIFGRKSRSGFVSFPLICNGHIYRMFLISICLNSFPAHAR